MADGQTASALLPFRAVRFRDDLPAGLAAVIGPPADLDSSERARAFVEDRPYSAVRLELSDDEHGARFLGARRLFDQWRRDGTLRRDPSQCYYVYEQEFIERGITRRRRGLFGLAPLDAPETVVLPHEDTWEENLRRRRHILRDIEASLSPILLLHNAPATLLEPIFAAIMRLTPTGSGFDDDGQQHRLWVVEDTRLVADISNVMLGRRYMIADGHHRFAAARAFHRAQPNSATGFVPALCIAEDDSGVVLRAIHRWFANDPDQPLDEVMRNLATWFDISEEPGRRRSGAELTGLLGNGELPAFVLMVSDDRVFRLTLRSFESISTLVSRRRPALRRLDVTVATDVLIAQGLGVDPTSVAIEYTNDADAIVRAIRSGAARMAVLLRPPHIQQVLAVAESHGRMPQKSTSFVPKVPIGLVMYDFLADRDDAGYAALV